MLGPGYVIGSLEDAGHEVKLFNFNPIVDFMSQIKYNLTLQKLILRLKNCDVICISALTLDMPLMDKVVKSIRRVNRNIPILVGGVHPTILKGEFLKQYPLVNYICIGEGESFIKEFVDKLYSPYSIILIKNLGYRLGNHIIVNDVRPPEDLSKLPLFPWHHYSKLNLVDQYGFASVRATRGCPFKCTFCCNSAFLDLYGKNYLRTRPIDDVITDMKYLKEHSNALLLLFADEMLVWDKEYSKNLFMRIKEEVNMPFGFMARVEYLDDDLIELAAKCGCRYVGIGVECGDENFRKLYLNRHMTNEKIKSVVNSLKTHGIYVATFNMIGYPYPFDCNLTKDTEKFNCELNPDYAQFSIFFPFPGTKLYNECVNWDLIDSDKYNITENLYGDSVLKDVTLHDERERLNKIFNQNGFLKL